MEWNPEKKQSSGAVGKVRNIYARGADDGFWMGLYFCALFGVMVLSLSLPVLNLLLVVMSLGVPALTYMFLRRTHVAAHGISVFSALWMQGIVMFACGCLIFGAASFVYMRWIDPGFMMRVLQTGIDFYESAGTDASEALAVEFRRIIEHRAIPSPSEITLGWMWLGMFSGSVLSMLVALLVKAVKVRTGV